MTTSPIVLLSAAAVFILAACGPAAPPPAPGCDWAVTVEVWSDADRDGQRDSDEPPLPDVQMIVFREDDPAGPELMYHRTSPQGRVEFGRTLPGDCGLEGLKLAVDAPPGYEAVPITDLADRPVGDRLAIGLMAAPIEALAAPAEVWAAPTEVWAAPTEVWAAPTEVQTAPTDPRQIPLLYPPMETLPIDGCPFAPDPLFENLIGRFVQPPYTLVIVAPPHYEARASVRCEARSEDNTAYVDVWYAPDTNAALADYDAVRDRVGEEAVAVFGLAEAAFWWPRGLRLEAVHADSRLTISLAAPGRDSANQAVALAGVAMAVIDPAAGAIRVERIAVPAGLSAPAAVYPRDLVSESASFEACSLLTQQEVEAALGPLAYPLVSGRSIVELGPHVYECMVDPHEPSTWMYYGLSFGEMPGDAILNARSGAANRPQGAVPVEGLGDRAWYWVSEGGAGLNLGVLRGNVSLNATLLMEDTPENRARLESLARLVLERLFERAAQG